MFISFFVFILLMTKFQTRKLCRLFHFQCNPIYTVILSSGDITRQTSCFLDLFVRQKLQNSFRPDAENIHPSFLVCFINTQSVCGSVLATVHSMLVSVPQAS
jgi:hypothetical protein